MSLDISLHCEEPFIPTVRSSGIFIRHQGQTIEITRDQFSTMNPESLPVVANEPEPTTELFSANITHNLSRMAGEAGVYDCLWRGDEHGYAKARQLVGPLGQAISAMRAEPERFKQLNPPNGWGSYDLFLPWLERLLAACEHWPDANLVVSR